MNYVISADQARLDVDAIYQYLSFESYWAKGRTKEQVQKSIENSVCFGVYAEGEQVGFARVITDCVTFAYLADVFILPDHRGNGLAKRLIETILSDPDLARIKRVLLATKDAHELYKHFGFKPIEDQQLFMERKK